MSDEKIQILIVDDEEAHAEAVADSLERAGYECTLARSGEDAIRKIEGEQFDIVLTDLVMGAVDGMEVLKRQSKNSPTRKSSSSRATGRSKRPSRPCSRELILT